LLPRTLYSALRDQDRNFHVSFAIFDSRSVNATFVFNFTTADPFLHRRIGASYWPERESMTSGCIAKQSEKR
jgi:hypothetical protein